MPLLLHISDTHFGTCAPPIVDALIAFTAFQKPDALVLSGDITQRALTSQFAAARAFVDALNLPIFLSVPGNHDIPLYHLAARVFNPYGRYRRFFGHDLEPVINTPDLLILGVNTTRRYRHKHGAVSLAQTERVARRLALADAGQLRIIVTHQPARVVHVQDERNSLRGGATAAQIWADAGADLLLGGHAHLPYILEVPAGAGVGGASPGSMHCLQAGTALSSRVRGGDPNSVNLVRWHKRVACEPHSCTAERWDYDASCGYFQLVKATPLSLHR